MGQLAVEFQSDPSVRQFSELPAAYTGTGLVDCMSSGGDYVAGVAGSTQRKPSRAGAESSSR